MSSQFTVVASNFPVNVTTNELTQILDYDVSGGAGRRFYRLSCYVVRQNNTSGLPLFQFTYGDYIMSKSVTKTIVTESPTLQKLDEDGADFSGSTAMPCLVIGFYADVGQDIVVSFQDSVGSPDDYAWAILEVF